MSGQEKLSATPVKEQELPKEELGSEADDLMGKLKTAVSKIPELQTNLPVANFNNKSLFLFHKGSGKHRVFYMQSRTGDGYPYEKLEITTVIERNDRIDSFERVSILIVKDVKKEQRFVDGYIFHTGSSISEGRPEDPQRNNETAVGRIEKFILSLAPPTPSSVK
jgi:hypothetical protein